MRPFRSPAAIALGAVLAVSLSLNQSQMQTVQTNYPPAPLGNVVDTYHGVAGGGSLSLARGCGRARRPSAWVDAQNALTRSVARRPRSRCAGQAADRALRLPAHRRPDRSAATGISSRTTPACRTSRCSTCRMAERRAPRAPRSERAGPDGTVALTALAINDDGTLVAYGALDKRQRPAGALRPRRRTAKRSRRPSAGGRSSRPSPG